MRLHLPRPTGRGRTAVTPDRHLGLMEQRGRAALRPPTGVVWQPSLLGCGRVVIASWRATYRGTARTGHGIIDRTERVAIYCNSRGWKKLLDVR
jgi:hypothetical protein